MVFAANTAQVITNRPDDERDMVNRRGAEIGLGTLSDNLAFHDRHRRRSAWRSASRQARSCSPPPKSTM